jgi:gliding motility-associated-like protein
MAERWILFVKLFFVFSLLFFVVAGHAQTCACPSTDDCNPCSGNIISLKLKYNGILPALAIINDNSSIIFIRFLFPGDVFTINGSGSGNNFSGNEVQIYVAGEFNVLIKANCPLQFYPGIIYGSFILLGAESKGGGTLCCTAQPVDITPPVINGCPNDITATANSACYATVSWNEPTVSDCDLKSLESNYSSGSQFPAGTTTVTYTATDITNNVSTCSFKVIVNDRRAPTVTDCPSTINVIANESCKGKATWTGPAFTDNCGAVTVTSTHQSGDEFPLGTTNVTYTAKDNSGNTTQCRFKVIVKDQTPPLVFNCPSTIKVLATASCKGKATWAAPIFTDNCSAVTVTSSHEPGDEFLLGTTTVTYTGTDANDNTTRCEFNVQVEDKLPPEIISCPDDIILYATDYKGMNASWSAATFNDCNGTDVSSNRERGDLYPIGNTVVNYTASDHAGNITNCSFNVIIKFQPPGLEIAKIISPDNNGINDEWLVGNIEKYESNEVVIVDRWGNVIFSASNYNNQGTVWNGSNRNGTTVPTGTYFYNISLRAGSDVKLLKGFIELIR